MPPRNEVGTLKDLCIDNITRNIVFHGQQYEKYSIAGKDISCYKWLRTHFTNRLCQKLFEIVGREEAYENEEFRNFVEFVLQRKDTQNIGQWPCLKFFFNENTSSVSFYLRKSKRAISQKIITYMADHCKNLTSITSKLDYFAENEIHSARVIPRFQNLQVVSLRICNTLVLVTILQSCPLIKSLSACEGSSTQNIFFSLCKHRPKERNFFLCPENGACCGVGKHLQKLHVSTIVVEEDAVACALQHLPELSDLSLQNLTMQRIDFCVFPAMVKGISKLQEAADATSCPAVKLKLTEMCVDNDSTVEENNTAFSACPDLDTVHLSLHRLNTKIFEILPSKQVKRLFLYDCCTYVTRNRSLKEFLLKVANGIESICFTVLSAFLNAEEDEEEEKEDTSLNVYPPEEKVEEEEDTSLKTSITRKGYRMTYHAQRIPYDEGRAPRHLGRIPYRVQEVNVMQMINDVLEICCNMKKLKIYIPSLEVYKHNYKWSSPEVMPSVLAHLDELILNVSAKESIWQAYILDLLCSAENVKYLDLRGSCIERVFSRALLQINYRHLEVLRLRNIRLSDIDVGVFLNDYNNLRLIELHSCKNENNFIDQCEEMKRNRNYKLEIYSYS